MMNADDDMIPDELNPRQRKFVEIYLSGVPAGQAYEQAGYRAEGARAEDCAARLLRRAPVAAAVARARGEPEGTLEPRKAGGMTREEAAEWLVGVIRTPVGEIDEAHPLAQEYTQDMVGGKLLRTKVKMVGKIEAFRLLAEMMGWKTAEKPKAPPEDALASLMKKLRNRN